MKRRQREGEEKEVNFPPRSDSSSTSSLWNCPPLIKTYDLQRNYHVFPNKLAGCLESRNYICSFKRSLLTLVSPKKQTHSHKSAVLTELKLSLTSAAGSMEGFQWLLIYDGLNVG